MFKPMNIWCLSVSSLKHFSLLVVTVCEFLLLADKMEYDMDMVLDMITKVLLTIMDTQTLYAF